MFNYRNVGRQQTSKTLNQAVAFLSAGDVAFLRSSEARQAIEDNLDRSPADFAIALSRGGFSPAERAALAGQLKYLQRSRSKLPRYYASRCIIPPLSFEQSSSEESAATKEFSGGLCIDLTCGLGVDSLNFSGRFDRVISVEADPVLCEVARYNFDLLGAKNIEVVNSTAEEFVRKYSGPKADLIYIDPARRGDDGHKVFLIHECSPDVLALMPRLKEIAGRIVIKLSPLFDVEEAFRLFGGGIAVEVVSSHGECKEVVVDIVPGDKERQGQIKVTATGMGSVSFPRCTRETATPNQKAGQHENPTAANPDPATYPYLLIPDVGFYKARLLKDYLPGGDYLIYSPTGFVLSRSIPQNFMGEAYKIDRMEPYKPKALKKFLSSESIRRLTILKKSFPLSTEEITRSLGISQGGPPAAFTEIGGEKLVFFLSATDTTR